MADDNLTVKIDSEAKDLFEQLWSESGQSKKDFMASIIAQYQSYSLQNGTELGIPELNALEQHVRRIVEIYTAMAGSRQDIANESAKKQLESTSELARIKAELLDAKEAAKITDANAKEFVHDIVTKSKEELDANKIKIDELIARAEKAEETAILTKQLLEAEQKMRLSAESIVTEMTKRAEFAESKFTTAQTDVAKLSAAVETATTFGAELNKTIVNLKAQITSLENKHAEQVANNKDHAKLELDRAVLIVEQEAFKQRQSDLLELDRLRKMVPIVHHNIEEGIVE